MQSVKWKALDAGLCPDRDVARACHRRRSLKFLVAALAIIPVARLIGHSTEHLSHYTGDSIGGLLNATFGNLPELIICVVALKAGLYAMVTASLIGAILFNLMLVLGLSFLLGGLRHHTLEFNTRDARYSTMMFIAVISMALPSIYEQSFAPAGGHVEQEKINIGLAILLIVLYGLYLVYMIRTHPEEFASVAKGGARARGTGACRCASACLSPVRCLQRY